MRLLTGLYMPEDEAENKRAIGRGERRKAEAEDMTPPPVLLEPCLRAGPGNDWCLLPEGHTGPCGWGRRRIE